MKIITETNVNKIPKKFSYKALNEFWNRNPNDFPFNFLNESPRYILRFMYSKKIPLEMSKQRISRKINEIMSKGMIYRKYSQNKFQ